MLVSIVQLECRDYYNSLAPTFSGTLQYYYVVDLQIRSDFFSELMLPPLQFAGL